MIESPNKAKMRNGIMAAVIAVVVIVAVVVSVAFGGELGVRANDGSAEGEAPAAAAEASDGATGSSDEPDAESSDASAESDAPAAEDGGQGEAASSASAGATEQGGSPTLPEASAPGASSEPEAPAEDPVPTCTVEVRCDTILSNWGSLAPGKGQLVPADGAILPATTVELRDGDTAFSVLERACAERGIALEYTFTPGFGSYYVEGIGGIYEFDCGDQSGWMCKVNGSFPNAGPSSVSLAAGDAVSWLYTCVGTGADLGAGV